MTENLLEVTDLTVAFPTRNGIAYAARGVDLRVSPGETLGVVGESGSGKSVTLRALVGLVPKPGEVLGGSVRLRDRELVGASARTLRAVRGRDVAMIFQDPTSCLNPVFNVGDQLTETIRLDPRASRRSARVRAVELLDHVGISEPHDRLRAYPHQLSGGMRQRVMIALALAGRPSLLLADEPTTALDVTVQDQILRLLATIQNETGMAMILVSHDLGIIARSCARVAVFYGGHVVEEGTVADIFSRPAHPYTRALLDATPRLRGPRPTLPLSTIPGQPPDLALLHAGCPFRARCGFAREACATLEPTLAPSDSGTATACPFVAAADHLASRATPQ